MKDQVKIEASVASHRGNVHSKNEEKFYLNGQYMDLHQQKDSTSKSAAHNYKQSVYGIASGTLRGELGEQAAFITIEALSRYHLYLEENTPSSFAVKKQQLVKHLEGAKEKISELSRAEEEEGLGATLVGLVLDKDQAFGFSVGEEGFYMIEEEDVRKVLMEDLRGSHYIGSNQPMEKILRITDEFALDEGDQLLLTSKDTYLPEMAASLRNLTKTLSPKESTKAFVKELLTMEGRKNLTALLVHVESLGSFLREDRTSVFAATDDLSDSPEPMREPILDSNQDPAQEKKQELKSEPEWAAEKDLKMDREKEPEEDHERERIFEQRYAESQLLFNKKLQRKDLNFSKNEEEAGDEAEETLAAYPDDEEEKVSWRKRSKFLLVAMLAVGVILMAFVFGSIRDLEARIGSSSVEAPEEESGTEGLEPEEASGDQATAGDEEPGEEEPNEEEPNEEEPNEEEPVEEEATDEESAEDDPDAGGERETVAEEEAEETVLETYEIQSGDTLYSISRDLYSDESMVEEIIRLNNIEDTNHIQVGDVIQLPPGE